MALVVKDRVKTTTTTTGTGSVTLGSAALGFQGFDVIGDGNTTYYAITDSSGDFEVGIGIYTASGTTLSRDTVLESSNSGSLVDFAAGSKDVFVTYPAERSVITVGSGISSDTGAIYINKALVTEDTVIPTGSNAMSAGPIEVDASATVTVSAGSVWVVL